jgi:hypothetical protein
MSVSQVPFGHMLFGRMSNKEVLVVQMPFGQTFIDQTTRSFSSIIGANLVEQEK